MEKTESKKRTGKLNQTLEFVAVALGLVLGIIFLDPVTIKSSKHDVSYTLNAPEVTTPGVEDNFSKKYYDHPTFDGFQTRSENKEFDI